jgi:hypothetical protein
MDQGIEAVKEIQEMFGQFVADLAIMKKMVAKKQKHSRP